VRQGPVIGVILLVAVTAIAAVRIQPSRSSRIRWSPDALFYEAKLLRFRGYSSDAALQDVFDGNLATSVRKTDPHAGDRTWQRYSQKFYERRVALPLVGSWLYPISRERTLYYLSCTGFVVSIAVLFTLLVLLGLSPLTAAIGAAATLMLQPLVVVSRIPLSDSWGIALELVALAAATAVARRGWRWIALWIAALVLLSFTRDGDWIPILAVALCAVRTRHRTWTLLALVGVGAALPSLILYDFPYRELLAYTLNNFEPPPSPSWEFIAAHYPRALGVLVKHDAEFRGEIYTALYFVGGIGALYVLARKRAEWVLIQATGIACLLYLLALPNDTHFRLELVFIPVTASGIALLAERAVLAWRRRTAVPKTV
jgi:hypothetical protein